MNTRIEPIELTDDELKAVAGGQFSVSNSFNNLSNSTAAAVNAQNSFNNSFND